MYKIKNSEFLRGDYNATCVKFMPQFVISQQFESTDNIL